MRRARDAAVGLAFVGALGDLLGEAFAQRTEETKTRLRSFAAWLRSYGAGVDNIEFAPSSRGRGNGVFYRPKHRSFLSACLFGDQSMGPVASFPASLALTIETPFGDPAFGQKLQELYDRYDLSPAVVLALYVLIQKKLETKSVWREWIQVLPEKIETPSLHYSPQGLEELKGTPLKTAAAQMRRDMEQTWTQIELPFGDLLWRQGMRQGVRCEEFLWAVGVVWSRAIEIPDAAMDRRQPCLGILPGLDTFNHSLSPNCQWMMSEKNGQRFYDVELISSREKSRRDRKELSISYGERTNEELLFLYGFTIDMNPYEVLRFPLQNSSRQNRQRPFQRPLSILPLVALPGRGETRRVQEEIEKRQREEELMDLLPPEIWEALQILQEEECATNGGTDQCPVSVLRGLEILRQSLERHRANLEGPFGTGPLENDISILEQPRWSSSPAWMWNAVVYRSVQKSLTREWLRIVAQIQQKFHRSP